MDPFEQNGPQGDRFETNTNQDQPFMNLSEQWTEIQGEQPSDTERSIGSLVGVIKKSCMFIIIGTGIVSLLLITIPVLRFVYEFSIWAFKNIGRMFH